MILIRRPGADKFTSDLIWNAAAFALSAALGVLVNWVIVGRYNADALGVFNQVYALYILLSQLAVGGVHLAVQALVPGAQLKGDRPDGLVTAALMIATISSTVVMALAWMFRALPGIWFESAGVGLGFPLVIAGLMFFSWNKVLLAFHNGARRMRLFAVFQLLRFTLMLGVLLVMVRRDAPAWQLPLVLTFTELLLFFLLLPVSLRFWDPRRTEHLAARLGQAFRFGNRALPGNLLLDVNTRVDVFLLGVFLSDRWVGLYSFAATVAEGVMYLPVLFRNNVNPVLARSWQRGGAPMTERVVRRSRRNFFRVLTPLIAATIVLFPLALWVLGMKDEPMTVWALFAILVGGAALTSGYQPFQMLFNQLGRPGRQTVFIFGIFLSNVVLNLALIPWLGVYGSALGTSLSFFTMVVLLKRMARTTFGLRL